MPVICKQMHDLHCGQGVLNEASSFAVAAGAQVNGMLLEGKKVYVGPFVKRTDRPDNAEVHSTAVPSSI